MKLLEEPELEGTDLDIDLDIDDEAKAALEEIDQDALAGLTRHSVLRRVADRLAQRLFATPKSALLSVSLIAAAVAVIFWNVTLRLEIVGDLTQAEQQQVALLMEVEALERELETLDEQALIAEIERESGRVFQSFPRSAEWLDDIVQESETLGVEASYRVEDAHPAPVVDTLEVPIRLQFSGINGARLPYQALMTMLGTKLMGTKHVEVTATKAEAPGRGLRTLTLDAQIWVQDADQFVARVVPEADAQMDLMEVPGAPEMVQ